MPQNYVIVKRKNPLKPLLGYKYYAVAKSTSLIGIRSICKRVSERSSYSFGELQGAVEEFLLEMKNLLAEGHSVQLGNMGFFRFTVSTANPTETVKEFSAANIKSCRIRFRPGADLKELSKGMTFTLFRLDKTAGTPEESPSPESTPKE